MAAVGFCVPPALTVRAVTQLGGSRVTAEAHGGSPGSHPTHLGYSQFPKGGLKAAGKSALVAPAVLPPEPGRSHHSWGWDSQALGGQTVTHRTEWDRADGDSVTA